MRTTTLLAIASCPLFAWAAVVSVVSLDGTTSLEFDAATASLLSAGGLNVSGGGATTLGLGAGACLPSIPTLTMSGPNVSITRTTTCGVGNASSSVSIVDTFSPAAESVQWTSSVAVDDPSAGTFSVPVSVGLGAFTTPQAQYWLPWTRGCVSNNPEMCFGSGAWTNPFDFAPLDSASPVSLFRLGNAAYSAAHFGPAGAASIADSFTIPLVSVAEAGARGVSLLLSPSDAIFDLLLRVNGTSLDYIRFFHRLVGGAPPLVFTMNVRAHAADWRPALRFFTRTHPSFALPHAANASDLDGLGSYSWVAPTNTSRSAALGHRTNWDLSGTFMVCGRGGLWGKEGRRSLLV